MNARDIRNHNKKLRDQMIPTTFETRSEYKIALENESLILAYGNDKPIHLLFSDVEALMPRLCEWFPPQILLFHQAEHNRWRSRYDTLVQELNDLCKELRAADRGPNSPTLEEVCQRISQIASSTPSEQLNVTQTDSKRDCGPQ